MVSQAELISKSYYSVVPIIMMGEAKPIMAHPYLFIYLFIYKGRLIFNRATFTNNQHMIIISNSDINIIRHVK